MEFAIILPVLTTISLACVDLGRVGHTQILIANAAELGAKVGASRWSERDDASNWEARIIEEVTVELSQHNNLNPEVIEVTVTAANESETQRWVRVQVEYPFELIAHWPALPDRVLLNKSAVAIATD